MYISYSHLVCEKSRCKYCSSEPVKFFYIGEKSPRFRTKRNAVDWKYRFSENNPKIFRIANVFSYSGIKSLKTTLKLFQYSKYAVDRPISVVLTCECMKTRWNIGFIHKPKSSEKMFDKKIKYAK